MAKLRGQGLAVEYRGYVDDRTLRDAYRSAFGLLQPSWHEGFGLPVLEAFSQGLPVIASDLGSLPEVSGGAALHCSASQPEKWVETMVELDQDKDLQKQLSVKGIERAAAFSWGKTAKTVLELAKSLAVT